MVLQSWTKVSEKTKHEQHKNHLLTISLLLILRLLSLKASKAVSHAVHDIELVLFQYVTVLVLISRSFKSCCREGNGLFRHKIFSQ